MYATGHPDGVLSGDGGGVAGGAVGVGAAGADARRDRAATATLFPLTVALVSFPIAGLVQRGNIELFLWIFAAAGTWAFLRGHENAAAVLWGLAAAMKLFPIVLLVLLLPRRRWRAFAVGWRRLSGRRCCRCGGWGRRWAWRGAGR